MIYRKNEKELIFKFFYSFSRFEYALKRSNVFLKGSEKNAEPDWDKFAKHYEGNFTSIQSGIVGEAVKYIRSKPPKKQVVVDEELKWSNEPNKIVYKFVDLLLDIRRIRNNLFHGGKYSLGPEVEPGRDTELLKSSITILEEIAKYDSNINMYYNDDKAQ